MQLIAELRRRNVFRVAAAYAVVAWLIVQVGDVAADNLGFPEWFMPMLFVLLGLGFPIALFLAWAFELTPEGMKREKESAPGESVAPKTGRTLDRLIIVVLALVLVVVLAERFWPDRERAPPVEIDRSIAVLPFDDFSPDGGDAWFANGLAEEILNALAQTPDLRVASRTSSFRYRESDQAVTEIGNALGVAHVLEGSVRRSPQRIRVTAQLIRSEDGFHVWSETYDREPSEVITIQEDIAASIANALETAMDPEALREMTQVGTRSVEAYTAYLQGLDLFRRTESAGQFAIGPAIEAVERATVIDPGFAEAAYRLAWLYRESARSSSMLQARSLSQDAAFDRAMEAIERAIDASSDSPTRLKYEAFEADMQRRFTVAQRRLEDYLALRPNDVQAWRDLAMLARKVQDRALLERAGGEMQRIAPEDPEPIFEVGVHLTLGGAMEDGVRLLEQALRMDPASEQIRYQTHRALLWAGRDADAARLEAQLLGGELRDTFKTAVRVRAACAKGDRSVAESIVRDNPRRWDRWYAQILLRNSDGATAELMSLDATPAGRDDLAGYLIYPFFDAAPFPNFSRELVNEGVVRAPVVNIPFACPPEIETSVAVLPFVNMSSNAEQEYFSDGITEEIINTLVRRTDLSVAARTSVFAFKGDNRNVSEIGRSLNVSHVIEGSVRSAGDQVRVTAQLIGVDDGFHLWSDSYDRQLTNIFAVQEEIAASVAEALSQALMPAGEAPRHATTDPQTYDLYLQARALLRLRREEQLTRAAELLAEATERDPRFAPAWATAAQVADVNERHDDAVEFAERALALDPRNVDALNALGAAYRDTYRWEDAEAKLLQALELDPESSELLEDYAEFLGATGRTEAMLDVARRGWLIDPYLPPLAAVYAEALMTAGRSEESLQVLDELSRMANMPGWIQSYRFAALREVAPDERLIELVADLPPPLTPLRALIIDALRDPGIPAKVDAVAEAVSRLDPSDFSPDTMISTYALLHLGRPEPVLDFQIRQAREWIPTELEWIHAPLFDDLRALPRFAELMEISRLPEYWDANGWPDYCERSLEGTIRCQ